MKLLVTGASGFIGKAVVKSLNTKLLAPASSDLNLLDHDQTKAYLKKHKPTHIIHLAWYAEHGKFWNAPENHAWVDATKNLLESFAAHGGQRFVAAGTCAEYQWGKEDLLKENASPLTPASLYGQCKNETRAFVQEFCDNSGIGWGWGRVFFPYGAGEPAGKLIPSLIAALNGKTKPFGINASVRRDFIHINDVGTAFKTLLETQDNGTFNIASGQGTSLQTLTEIIARLLDTDPAQILQLSPKAIDPVPCIAGDVRKMKAIGWKPQTALQDGLTDYVRVLLKQQ